MKAIDGMRTVRLRACYPAGSIDGRPGWRLAFPFEEEAVAVLGALPYGDREWHPAPAREWWVAAQYEPMLRHMFPSFAAFADAPRLL
jgi:hypothetical protein